MVPKPEESYPERYNGSEPAGVNTRVQILDSPM